MTGRGSIYDLGYRSYEGQRLGRRGAIGALIVDSVRIAFGLGRSARSKIVPWILTALAVLPALLALGIIALVSQLGEAGEAIEAISPVRYSTLFPLIATLVMLFCASQAPELFGRDQRSSVLSLYFTRAVSRDDYAFSRLAGLFSGLAILVLAPQLILFVGRVLAAFDPLEGLSEEVASLPAAIAAGILVAGVFGTVAAAVAALTPRRSYATAAIIAVFIVPTIVAQLLAELSGGPLASIAVLLSPGEVLDGANAALFGSMPDSDAVLLADLPEWSYIVAAIAWIGGATLVLMRRYRTLLA